MRVDTDLDALEAFFDRHGFFGAPVLEYDDRLVGVVRRSAVEHALSERAGHTLLRSRGIVGGEELRTMAFSSRLTGRLAFLVPYIGLNLVAGSVIAVAAAGGTLPLALKRLRMDPALASGPVLTTVTDFCGFFLVLGLAAAGQATGVLPVDAG